MREERRRQRAEKRRRERQKQLMRRVAVGTGVAAILAIIAIFAALRTSRGGKRPSNAPVVQTESTAVMSTTDEVTNSEVSAPAAPLDISQVDLRYLPESASTADEALTYAEVYRLQYNYDKALALLRSVPGYESISSITEKINEVTAEKNTCVAVDVTTIPHVFFHSLINDDRGLREDIVGRDRAWRNDAAMTTAVEFDHMMDDMYAAGYVLVSLDDMCVKTKDENGKVLISKNTNLMLPPGKKPFVMSEDDLSYYHTYGIGTQGYATKMVLDADGRVKCEYTNENGETLIGDYDVVPRLDTFIRNHPDFAYHNARPTVALTGYNGVFGYRTNDYYKDINNPKLDRDQIEWLENHPDFDWDEDVRNATAIANAMKEEGWTFASHTYAHWNASSKSLESLISDNERWMTVNHPIVGDIDKIIFAFGGDIGVVGGYTADNEKFQYFKSQGYNIFCNVDGNIGWTEFGNDYMRTGRVALDGFTMYQAMTPDAPSHGTYARDYEILGIKDISSFFNQYRITPIDSE